MNKLVLAVIAAVVAVAAVALFLLFGVSVQSSTLIVPMTAPATGTAAAEVAEPSALAAKKSGRVRAEETPAALAIDGVVKTSDGRPVVGAVVEAYAVPAGADVPDDERVGRARLEKIFGKETGDRLWTRTKGLRDVGVVPDPSKMGEVLQDVMPVVMEMFSEDGELDSIASVMTFAREAAVFDDGDWPKAGAATSAADGTFRIEGLPAGRIELRAKAPSFVKAKKRVDAGASGVAVELAHGVRVTGTVTCEKAPVAGAVVAIKGAQVATGADGRFEFDAAHVPIETLVASAPDCCSAFVILSLAADSKEHDIQVELEPGGTVTGHVAEFGGAPIAGARVALSSGGNVLTGLMSMMPTGGRIDLPVPPTVTDAAGAFELRGVHAGLAKVRFDADGYLGTSVAVSVKKGGVATADGLLTRESVLSGAVVDDKGSPVAGARIRVEVPARDSSMALFTQLTGGTFRSSTSDASGRYEVRKLSAGDRKVRVQAAGHLDLEERIAVPAQGVVSRDFALREGYRLAGTVAGPDGKPVAGAKLAISGKASSNPMVSMMQMFGVRGGKPTAESGADGRWTATGLQEGPYQVKATAEGYLEADVADVQAGRTDVALVLGAASTIRGRVVSAVDGSPVAGASVQRKAPESGPAAARTPAGRRRGAGANPFQALFGGGAASKTADDGTFEMKGLEAGDYELVATRKGFADGEPLKVACAAGQVVDGVEIRLAAGVAVSGRVVERGSGAAVPGAVVWAARADASPFAGVAMSDFTGGDPQAPESVVSTRTDASGAFVLDGVPPGTVTLEARVAGHAPSTLTGATAPASEVVLQVSGGGGIEGRVTGSDGAPVAGAQIMANRGMAMVGASLRQTRSDSNGDFRFEHLPEGNWQLVMTDPQSPFMPGGMATVTVKDGEVARHDFTKKTGTQKVGGGATRDGKPLAGAPVMLLGGTNGMRMSTTDDQGRFSFDGLESGEYTVLVQPSFLGSGNARRRVTVGSDGKVEDLAMEIGSLTIEGEVVDADGGSPISGAQVLLSESAGGARLGSSEELLSRYSGQTITDERGRFVVRDLRAGVYSVRVSAGSFAASVVDGVSAGSPSVRVQLQRGVEFQVTVLTPDGRPSPGAFVTSTDSAGREGLSLDMTMNGMTRQDGVAHLRLAPGRYTVTATASNYLPASAEVETAAGGATLRLDAGATIEVAAKDESGAPVPNAKISVLDAAGVDIPRGFTPEGFTGGGTRTNAEGLYTRGGLPAGPVTVVVADGSGRESHTDVVLVSGSTKHIDAVLVAVAK